MPGGKLPLFYANVPQQIETKLNELSQIPVIQMDENSGPCDLDRIKSTAEFYRIAALIYLHESLLQSQRTSNAMQNLVKRSLIVMKQLKVCTSPWPLFMTACAVVNDEQRLHVLQALDLMQRVRGIGNVDVMRDIIETLWKRRDMDPNGAAEANINWRTLFDTELRIPSFI